MIKRFSDYNEVKTGTDYKRLPKGGYIMLIRDAYTTQTSKGKDAVIVEADIAEGDYRGFFTDRHNADTRAEKEWPFQGRMVLTIPTDDGSKGDNYLKTLLKRFTTALEESNPGYVFDWDEKKFIGKRIGAVYGLEEYKDKKSGDYKMSARWSFVCSVQDIKTGNFQIPKDKTISQAPTAYAGSMDFMKMSDSDKDELPFR